jgi:hypothetical protein
MVEGELADSGMSWFKEVERSWMEFIYRKESRK